MVAIGRVLGVSTIQALALSWKKKKEADNVLEQYALLEAYYIVARMVQRFKVLESRDDQDWMELYALALCSKNGTKVALTI